MVESSVCSTGWVNVSNKTALLGTSKHLTLKTQSTDTADSPTCPWLTRVDNELIEIDKEWLSGSCCGHEAGMRKQCPLAQHAYLWTVARRGGWVTEAGNWPPRGMPAPHTGCSPVRPGRENTGAMGRAGGRRDPAPLGGGSAGASETLKTVQVRFCFKRSRCS